MAFQRVPKVWKIDLVYGYGSGPDIINTLYGRDTTGARNVAAAEILSGNVHSWWDDNVRPLIVDDLTLREIRVTDIDSQFGAKFNLTVNAVGEVVAAPAPAVVAALVHFNGDPGQAPRDATIFHPGLAEAQITDGALDPDFATDVASAYNALRTEIDSVGLPNMALVIVSRYEGHTIVERENGTRFKRATQRDPAISNTIASVTVPLRYGVQKRRRPSPL